jgi:Protein of unknown function (DUF3987)/RepB DNA-primase from phage plasmid
MPPISASPVQVRVSFFDYLFGDDNGYLYVATGSPEQPRTGFRQYFFQWPQGRTQAAQFIQQQSVHNNVWFGVCLYSQQIAQKEYALPGSFVWADLDGVSPRDCEAKGLTPTCAVLSSPGRYQGYWRITQRLPADVLEDLSKKLAYYIGADKSGWDRTQLLRAPITPNHKYPGKPSVDILHVYESLVPVEELDKLPDPIVASVTEPPPSDMPDVDSLPAPEQILYKYAYNLSSTAFIPLYAEEPHESDDWSKRMWRLINLLLEQGLSPEETFAVCIDAKCNKYVRDNRPPSYLWKEVIKAEGMRKRAISIFGEYKPLSMPELVDPKLEFTNFVTEYCEWAGQATDAVPEYHELCGFIMLSALMSAGLKLEASFGRLIPNLWGLILGDSTLTRKTTAMEMAMAFIKDVDDSIIIATDGSPEGVVTTLSNRPDMVSVFYKDEISGLFDAINKKNYLADMPEILTKMYDVPTHYTRTLAKGPISVNNPYFIFFGGGIRDNVYTLLNEQYVLSGFLPRFLVVSGEANLDKLKPTGPPDEITIRERLNLVNQVHSLYAKFNGTTTIKIGSQDVEMPMTHEVKLTDSAWGMFAEMEDKLVRYAADVPNATLALPTFTRLAFSTLKMAILLAATRGPDMANRVIVNDDDLRQAAWYTQRWGRHSIDLVNNAGISKDERTIDKVLAGIKRKPGITKTGLMQTHRIQSRDMNEVIQTLHDRGLIEFRKEGRGMKFWAIE